MIETSAVSSSIARATCSASSSPSASTGTRVTRQPSASSAASGATTEGCSTLDATMWRRPEPRAGAAQHSTVLFDSVAPPVKRTSSGSTPISDATLARPISTCARAVLPSACTLEGLPGQSRNTRAIVSTTSSRTGVVAL
jgi:hypothetical protein